MTGHKHKKCYRPLKDFLSLIYIPVLSSLRRDLGPGGRGPVGEGGRSRPPSAWCININICNINVDAGGGVRVRRADPQARGVVCHQYAVRRTSACVSAALQPPCSSHGTLHPLSLTPYSSAPTLQPYLHPLLSPPASYSSLGKSFV